MESTDAGPTPEHLHTVYPRRSQNSVNPSAFVLQGTQVSFHCAPSTDYDL